MTGNTSGDNRLTLLATAIERHGFRACVEDGAVWAWCIWADGWQEKQRVGTTLAEVREWLGY